ncbi:MAG: DUF1800 domain-containing protein [Raineya sp.]|jgi:uncharacterized protein (DUF1800 family)|nr:DUF1800 domain-containing protein [Raineya sp.]
MKEQQKIQHLYFRACFGIDFNELEQQKDKNLKKVLKEVFEKNSKIKNIEIVEKPKVENRNNLTEQEKRLLRKGSRQKIKNLNIAWLKQMAEPEYALREKMTLFWHNHFACKTQIAYLAQKQNNLLRKHALGKFGDLLHEIAKDSAMLQFLNNQQNRKEKPNENFARELMELFTLGRGNYSEKDIKEAARAFTGWGFDFSGEYVFRERQHDFESKMFLGKTGNFNGNDIIDIILENPQTANFIVKKLYINLVNDKFDEAIVQELATFFRKTDYDIKALLEKIFSSDWFYEQKNIGTHIKSPIELLVHYQKFFGLDFEDDRSWLFIQKVLGQILLYPPNVAGWQEGKNWIDSSSLLFRMTLPDLIFGQIEVDFNSKDDGDADTEGLGKRAAKTLQAKVDWSKITKQFLVHPQEEIAEKLQVWLLSLKPTNILENTQSLSKEVFTKNIIRQLTASPEFQLC